MPEGQSRIVTVVALLLVGAVHLTSLRAGDRWDEAAAQYMLHARNIAFGLQYDGISVVPNPDRPSDLPAALPPMTAVVLAPVHRAFGPSILPMKSALALVLMCALAVMNASLRTWLSATQRALLIVAVGLNPLVWDVTRSIGPAALFLLWVWASLGLTDAVSDPESGRETRFLRSLVLGLVIALGAATRTSGVALVVMLPVYAVVRYRRVPVLVAMAAVIAAGLIAWQQIVLPMDGGLIQGVIHDFTWRVDLLPLVALTIALAIKTAGTVDRRASRGVATASLSAVLLVGSGAWIVNSARTPSDGPLDPAFAAVVDFVKQRTAAFDRVIIAQPRMLAALTGRYGAAYDAEFAPDRMQEFARRIGARYAVLATPAKVTEAFRQDETVLLPFLQGIGPGAREMITTGKFVVWRLY